MSESIESLKERPPLEVVDLPTDKLDPDPMNPNRVGGKLMAALRRDIEERGFVQPVVVRPVKGGRYVIVDGEHRWRVLSEQGAKAVPCVIDDASEDEARMRMLALNRLRGSFNPVELARTLRDLAGQMSESELIERLGMDEEEFDTAIAELDEDELGEKLSALLAAEEAEAPQAMRFRVGPRQKREVERAVEALVAEGKTRAESLLAILSFEE